jgi:hypothetical protein
MAIATSARNTVGCITFTSRFARFRLPLWSARPWTQSSPYARNLPCIRSRVRPGVGSFMGCSVSSPHNGMVRRLSSCMGSVDGLFGWFFGEVDSDVALWGRCGWVVVGIAGSRAGMSWSGTRILRRGVVRYVGPIVREFHAICGEGIAEQVRFHGRPRIGVDDLGCAVPRPSAGSRCPGRSRR